MLLGYPYNSTNMEWRPRRVVPAAAVTTHAKPHAQQQLARDPEEELLKPFSHSGQGDIWVPVQQYKHGVASPPRGARGNGHDSCQAARTAVTCT